MIGWLQALLVVMLLIWVRLLWRTTEGLRDWSSGDVWNDLLLFMVGAAMVSVAMVLRTLY